MNVFQFPAEVRGYVESLADLMYFANSKNDGLWATERGGVYGAAVDTITTIIREVVGETVAKEWRDFMELGANKTFLDDVEVAVQNAIGWYYAEDHTSGTTTKQYPSAREAEAVARAEGWTHYDVERS